MKPHRITLSICALATLTLAGCSTPSSAQPATNSAHVENGTNASTTTTGQGQSGSNNVTIGNITNETVSNATSSSQTQVPTDMQAVIASEHTAPARMQPTVHATVLGQPYGKGLQAVRFISPTTGFLAGNGIILKTTDGGMKFQTAFRTSVNIQGLSIAKDSPRTVVAWGGHFVLVSQDEGLSWHVHKLAQTTGSVQTVDYASASEGFALTGERYDTGELWRTTDGGVSWQKVTTPEVPMSISFGSPQVGWMGSKDGNIYETKDGGLTWARVFHPAVKYPGRPEVQAASARACWAMVIGQSGMSQTAYAVFRTQNGADWKPVLGINTAGAGPAPDNAVQVPAGPGSSPGPMVALGPNQAVVTGDCEACGMGAAQVATTKNGGVSWTSHPTIQNGMSLPRSMSFVSLNEGWVLDATYSGGSVLLHTVNGGQSWTEVYPMVHPHPVEDISFLNGNVGYGLGIPGNADAVLKTVDGGYTFTQVGLLPAETGRDPMTLTHHAIDFVSPEHGYAVGPDGRIYESTDGGRTWTQSNIPQSGTTWFSSITFVENGQYGLAYSYAGQVEETADGGRHWQAVHIYAHSYAAPSTDLYLAGIARLPVADTLITLMQAESASWLGLLSGKIAVVPGQNGRSFFITSDGGSYWRNIDFGSASEDPSAAVIDFVNDQDGWMIDVAGGLLRTTNGGKTWVHAAHHRG
jgi:photosystem II stability/assembly factor-like uncharacterized protein